MDRRRLRKINQLKNHSKPSPRPEQTRATQGERDPITGRYFSETENKGIIPTKRNYDASVSEKTQVQLQAGAKRIDHKDATPVKAERPKDKEKSQIKTSFTPPNPDNPLFGNCKICNGTESIDLDCKSGLAEIIIGTEAKRRLIPTPSFILFGGKIKYRTNDDKYGERCFNACTPPETIIALIPELGIDPETIEYECVIRGYLEAEKYRVSWETLDGETVSLEDYRPLGYRIEDATTTADYNPGTWAVEGKTLVYNSGIPRTFTVSPSGNSNGGAYFQIYQYNDEPCKYDIVAIATRLQYFDCTGRLKNLPTHEIIYTGGCGFEVTLGASIAAQDNILRIYNFDGELIMETPDYKPGTVTGGLYDGSKITSPIQDDDPSLLVLFEETISADAEKGIPVPSVRCIVAREGDKPDSIWTENA